MDGRTGVAFIGSGQATQAIHLPVLAGLGEHFRVHWTMDVSTELAWEIADRCDARATADEHHIYDDDEVEVVVVCSPNAFHAAQVIACCEAGKKVVLCEKPLALTHAEAESIKAAALSSGTALLVGNMHSYDPALRRACAGWNVLGERARLVRSAIYLPANDVFIEQATDPVAASPSAPGSRQQPSQSERLRTAILGLAVHNLPLVREFCPNPGTLREARSIEPYGYSLTLSGERHAVLLSALMPGEWPAQWSFLAVSNDSTLRVAFPPSYVLAGSARAELVRHGETSVIEEAQNGYEAMWDHVLRLCREEEEPQFALDTVIADIDFAIDLAAEAGTLVDGAK